MRGGSDDISNLVSLLPEEHLFAHKLRYKAYNDRVDMLAVRFIVNKLANSGYIERTVKMSITKHIKNTYSWIRQHSYTFRTAIGWHTEEGIRRISEARKGKMPVKNSVTGEKIGMADVNHPKVLSGEWVHHTKGRKWTEKERANARKMDGKNNFNYKHFVTVDFLLDLLYNNKKTRHR